MEQHKEETLQGQLHLLDPATVTFTPTPGGYLSMTDGENTYSRVKLCRALPYYEPEKYICVCNPEDGTEYGMIADLAPLPEEQKALIRQELSRLYFMPTVTAIRSAKMKMGFMEFEVDTDLGPRSFRMRDPSRNIRWLTPALDRRVQLTDCDGNRYLIPDAMALDKKSRNKIDTYLV